MALDLMPNLGNGEREIIEINLKLAKIFQIYQSSIGLYDFECAVLTEWGDFYPAFCKQNLRKTNQCLKNSLNNI